MKKGVCKKGDIFDIFIQFFSQKILLVRDFKIKKRIKKLYKKKR